MTFAEFTQKKVNDYCNLVDFTDEKISLQQIRESNLPPYIINFFEFSRPGTRGDGGVISKAEFEEVLKKAVVFNINYIIRPKQTLLKFLFGDVETKPADFILNKLNYFQFYSYYTNHITEFINLNSPLVLSSNQIESLINEINDKIYDEISDPSIDDAGRLNLIKLLYFFFIELVPNNPVNIKLPKTILSAFFSDKGFKGIKSKVDNFFSEEIFIQEVIDLMKPAAKKKEAPGPEKGKKAIDRRPEKTGAGLIVEQSSDKDIEIAGQAEIKNEASIQESDYKSVSGPGTIKESGLSEDEMPDVKTITGSENYPDEIIPVYPEDAAEKRQLSPEEIRAGIIDTLFCEETYRRKIIRKIFRRDENKFREAVSLIIDVSNWKNASLLIAELFDKYGTDYLSEEAVKFVDIIQNYFSEREPQEERNSGSEEL